MVEVAASRPSGVKASTSMLFAMVYAVVEVKNWVVMALKREEDVRYSVIPVAVKGSVEVEVKAHELGEMVVVVVILVPISVRGR